MFRGSAVAATGRFSDHEEAAKHSWQTAAVRRDDFWQLIDRARMTAETGARPPTGDDVGRELTSLLTGLPLAGILSFQQEYDEAATQVHRWEFCAACFLISGSLSDDGFSDFKAGLIGLGRDTFHRILADPDDLADVAIVQAMAAGDSGRQSMRVDRVRRAQRLRRPHRRRGGLLGSTC